MRMIAASALVVALLVLKGEAFAPLPAVKTTYCAPSTSLSAVPRDDASNNKDKAPLDDRRSLFQTAALATTALVLPSPALAVDVKKVVVAGATGQTGRRVLERLASKPGLTVVAGVRNVNKAEKALSESSTVIRGAMVQNVASVDTTNVQFAHLDVVQDSVDALANTLQGADALVICTGFIPGNPLKMGDEAHKVDNVGTCRLVDAAKQAGVKKVVMVSSILTNGRNWGQEKSPGFVVTNAFGGVLDEKIVAENYLRKSGADYTIVRPGGLKAKPPSGALIISKEDTLTSGEISRDLVADVCVASLTDGKASNKVLEIVEDEEGGPKVFNGLNM